MPRLLLRLLLAALFGISIGVTRPAHAFPEMVRHNYPNCISCHVSPSGGGVLTQYGRSLSSAILSTWGTESETESQFAYGLVKPPSWLDVMGVYRGVYAYQNTPFIQQGKYIYMEGDVEAAAHYGKWYLDVMAGYQNPTGANDWSDHLISRRHYLGYQPTEDTSVRFGRYFVTYGINTPVHTIPTKQDLGWDEAFNQESYNLELAWLNSVWNVYATADFGRFDDPAQHHETGGGLTASAAIADHYKVGASYFHGDAFTTTRNVFGPWGILGFTPHFYLLTELDFQQQATKNAPGTTDQWGVVNYQKLAYEFIQGVHAYLTQDYSRLSFRDVSSQHNSFGAGIQWYPRPHFELDFQWQKLKATSYGQDYTDFAYLMLNVYI